MDDIFRGMGIEVKLNSPDDFLKIKETLTRIGISSKKDRKLFQSCHILHKQGRYSIFHFKELFKLDGKNSDLTDDDLSRRNTIANLLEEWKLIEIIDNEKNENFAPLSQIKILSHKEKSTWELVAKYNVGKKVSYNGKC